MTCLRISGIQVFRILVTGDEFLKSWKPANLTSPEFQVFRNSDFQ
jgi:hypothetical protein